MDSTSFGTSLVGTWKLLSAKTSPRTDKGGSIRSRVPVRSRTYICSGGHFAAQFMRRDATVFRKKPHMLRRGANNSSAVNGYDAYLGVQLGSDTTVTHNLRRTVPGVWQSGDAAVSSQRANGDRTRYYRKRWRARKENPALATRHVSYYLVFITTPHPVRPGGFSLRCWQRSMYIGGSLSWGLSAPVMKARCALPIAMA